MQAPFSICTELTGDGDAAPRSGSQDEQQNSVTKAATTTTTEATTTTTKRTTTTTKRTTTTTKKTTTTTKRTTTTTKRTTTTTKRTTTKAPSPVYSLTTSIVAQNPQPMPRSDEGSDALTAKHSNILIFVTLLIAHMYRIF